MTNKLKLKKMKFLVWCVICFSILIEACNNSNKEKINTKTYNINVDGKNATFILPSNYHKNNEDDHHDEESMYRKFSFNSNIGNSVFKLVFIEDGVTGEVEQIDSCANFAIKAYSLMNEQAVVWKERKEKNNHIHYYVVNMYRIKKRNKNHEIFFSDSVYSSFEYLINYGNKSYSFMLCSKDHINDFSYESKRKILESIKFE